MEGTHHHTPTGNEARLTEIQALVVDVINNLLSAGTDYVDDAVLNGLKQIGAFTQRDRAYVFMCHEDTASNTHEWCAPGTQPMMEHLQNLPVSEFEGLVGPFSKGEIVHVADISDFDESSNEYAILASQGIRSVLMVPMLEDTKWVGFVGFDSVADRADFLPGEVYLLQSFADVVRSVLLRRTAMLEMRRAREELAHERAFLQGIVSTNAAGFTVFEHDGTVIFCNDAAESILGLPRDEIVGKHVSNPDWVRHDAQGNLTAIHDEPFLQVQRTGQVVVNHRVALPCPDGVRHASYNAAPIPTDTPGKPRVVYAITDVTAQVNAEQEREAALEQAHRANIAKSNFLAKMSHEIRTPLNGILGIADILSDTITDPAQSRMLGILQDSGGLLMGIINDLLDMTKIEADALELEQIPFDLSELARRTEDVHTLRASEQNISFSVTIDDSAGQRRLGDPKRLAQILHNIISNALKFTETGFVAVSIEAPDTREVVLTVKDSGIGMSKAQKSRIFDPFAQADSSIARRFGGTGLGMSIVKRLVDMMQGTITIDSAENSGTTVQIRLPLPAVSGANAPAAQSKIDLKNGATALPLRPLKVLAADDNRTNQMILAMMLGQLGAEVSMADDGITALEQFAPGQFDILIFDISMPGMDGVTLLSEIHSREDAAGLARTKSIAFTANAMTHQLQTYLDAGFDACLTKPLCLQRLHETLQTLSASADPIRPDLTNGGDRHVPALAGARQ